MASSTMQTDKVSNNLTSCQAVVSLVPRLWMYGSREAVLDSS
jgi:hypothetical protein